MSMNKRAFTLIELLVVIAIVAVVAAITFPVIAGAKRSGKRAVSISNLRQCGLALSMYTSDYDGILPEAEVAKGVLQKAPTCDPGDTWRANCQGDWGDPL